MIEIKAPNSYSHLKNLRVFLAGSIDQGKAVNWQDEVVNSLKDFEITILNPRRNQWDPTWIQSIDNPKFKEQVLWELEAQEHCDLDLFVFTKESKAPITFFELGRFSFEGDVIVCCEEGFYRQGNIDIICEKYKIPIYHNFKEFIEALKIKLHYWQV